MPCQLAVSITKVVIAQEALRRLLAPSVLEAVLVPWFNQHYASEAPSVQVTPIGVTCRVGPVTVAVTYGTITVRAGVRTALGEQLVAQLASVVRDTVAFVWVQQVCRTLRSLGAVTLQTVRVVEGDSVLPATLVTLCMADVDDCTVRVVVLPDGRLQLFVDGAITFARAQAATLQILGHLRAAGLPVQQVGAIEQHKDGVSHVHLVAYVEHAHDH